MPALTLLLIEDSSSDATIFCDQIQQKLGANVHIVWKRSLSKAFEYLQKNEVDQIWMDNRLPELEGTEDIGKILTDLKSYVGRDELYLLSTDRPITGLRSAARSKQIEILSKEVAVPSEDEKILEIVTKLWERKSSGGSATTRVELAKLEGAIARLEVQVEQHGKALGKTDQIFQAQEMMRYELGVIKENLNKLLAAADKQQQSRDAFRLERMKVFGTILVTAITAGASIMGIMTQIVLPKWVERQVQQQIQHQTPAAPPFPPPTKK